MAGGSRIIISDQGVTISTNGQILYQAGQHKFEVGQKVVTTLPNLPTSNLQGFNHGFNLIGDYEIKNLALKLFNSKRSFQFNANLDDQQQTQFVETGTEAEKLELKYSGDDDFNHQWKNE